MNYIYRDLNYIGIPLSPFEIIGTFVIAVAAAVISSYLQRYIDIIISSKWVKLFGQTIIVLSFAIVDSIISVEFLANTQKSFRCKYSICFCSIVTFMDFIFSS
jgi:hypothetical protein